MTEFNQHEEMNFLQTAPAPTPSLKEVVGSLSKMQIASIKRIHATLKPYQRKAENLHSKISKLYADLHILEDEMKVWETPVQDLLKGYRVLDVVHYLELNKQENKAAEAEDTTLSTNTNTEE